MFGSTSWLVRARRVPQAGDASGDDARTIRICSAVRRVRILASGTVQGVFFRQATLRLARELGCAGWVMNRKDGRLEAVFEGPAEVVERMVAFCREGPKQAVVDAVEVFEETPEGLGTFEVRYAD